MLLACAGVGGVEPVAGIFWGFAGLDATVELDFRRSRAIWLFHRCSNPSFQRCQRLMQLRFPLNLRQVKSSQLPPEG